MNPSQPKQQTNPNSILSYDKSNSKDVNFGKDDKSQKSISKDIKLYYVPILTTLIFFLILSFLTIPSITKVFETIELRNKAEELLTQKRAEKFDLESLRNERQANEELRNRLEKIIPTKQTEVVNFERKIQKFSTDALVKVDGEIITGERLFVDSDKKKTAQGPVELKLIQIPMQVKLKGAINDFRKMLSLIYNSDDFIVITEMKLDIDEKGEADMDLILSKYQYGPLENPKDERTLLDSVSMKERPDKYVVKFIEKKTATSEMLLESED